MVSAARLPEMAAERDPSVERALQGTRDYLDWMVCIFLYWYHHLVIHYFYTGGRGDPGPPGSRGLHGVNGRDGNGVAIGPDGYPGEDGGRGESGLFIIIQI